MTGPHLPRRKPIGYYSFGLLNKPLPEMTAEKREAKRLQYHSRLNHLVSFEGANFKLKVISSRLGGQYIAFLAFSDTASGLIGDQFTSGDDFYEVTYSYFTQSDWYPMTAGKTVQEAVWKLTELVNKVDAEVFHKDWALVVEIACLMFCKAVREGNILTYAKENKLPSFSEYANWVRKKY